MSLDMHDAQACIYAQVHTHTDTAVYAHIYFLTKVKDLVA